VEAAVQPGAFGHGVPLIKDVPYFMNILPWIGLAVGVAIAAVLAAKVMVPRMRYVSLIAQ
jgi:hypothetical protein